MLDVKDLNIEFHDHLVPETVVHQVSFHMDAGEIVGLVGESGSGKSMTALAIAGLLSRHDMKKTGEILFEGTDLLHCERSFLRELQGNDISVVFQAGRWKNRFASIIRSYLRRRESNGR